MKNINLTIGYRTALLDGVLVDNSKHHMVSEELHKANSGDRICLLNGNYIYAIAIYSLERNLKYCYTYDYQKEENWTTYTQNLSVDSYTDEEFVFSSTCFFRVNVKRKDGQELLESRDDTNVIALYPFCENQISGVKTCFAETVDDTIKKLGDIQNDRTMTLCVVADSHYTINGTWEDTANNIFEVNKNVKCDAIIHLGDLTDGMVSKKLTSIYVSRILSDLGRVGVPVYITLGNHDYNYFHNQHFFTDQEIEEVYRLKSGKNYFVDQDEYGVRMIFLDSFDNNATIRYGYQKETIEWVQKVIYSSKPNTKFIFFSHCPPLACLDYWSYYTRNGRQLLELLDDINHNTSYHIIAFFYGHTHADYVFEKASFPIISTACSKLESFPDKKPKDVCVWGREAESNSQDLWDDFVFDFEKEVIHAIRFGAGVDRSVSFAKKDGYIKRYLESLKRQRKSKVWAHRGASAYAPENTMPAFELAYDMGADGIELDVQMSKDGVLVICHDETIQRTSNGEGRIIDYTIDELKTFHFANGFHRFGSVRIPTLEEFLALVCKKREEGIVIDINLELKNNVVFYEGIEKKVVDLITRYKLEEVTIYSSFNHLSLLKVKQIDARSKIAFIYSEIMINPHIYGQNNSAFAMHPSINSIVDKGTVELFHSTGQKVHVWTANQECDIQKMLDYGVDAIITNHVDLL